MLSCPQDTTHLSPHDALQPLQHRLPAALGSPPTPGASSSRARLCGVAEMGGPTNRAFCLILKAQLSQALEELGSQKQRADMVSPGHALRGLCQREAGRVP